MGVIDRSWALLDVEQVKAVRPRSLWRRILREPLLHFVVAGALLFAAVQAWRTHHDVRRIVVTPARVAELSEKYRLQVGAPPTPDELEHLVDRYVEEEVLYREGMAMGLDRDDEIVRRRIAQKVEFLTADRTLPANPDEAALRAYFASHVADYVTPVRTTFHHLFFSTDAAGDAQARAVRALAQLQAGAPAESVGADVFPDLDHYADFTRDEAVRLFGGGQMAAALDTAPVGRWSGPYRSAYGWHLVRVDGRQLASRPRFEEVRDRVYEDAMRDAQAHANAQAMARLKSRYAVVRADLKSAP